MGLKLGDVVRLKSGGIPVTIISFDTNTAPARLNIAWQARDGSAQTLKVFPDAVELALPEHPYGR